ncbi:lipocalin family protein [Parvularcula oceani]|uniref:lipocalin family protein n=1 Tax=Parvularcula oceani TaxID=1247963 RepID=UPI0004E1D554|nr:lipocalin family protein [Parvularcula oceani]
MPLRPLCAALLLTAACGSQPDHRAEEAPPETVAALDLQRYSGLWYEIMRYPNRFEEGCAGVTAEYALREDGRIAVTNTCRQGAPDGPVEVADGVAKRVGEAKLKVRFAPSFVPFAWGDYWVLALEGDYSAALVGSPDGKYLWILARDPSPPEAVIRRMIAEAEARGYETAPLIRTEQPPE